MSKVYKVKDQVRYVKHLATYDNGILTTGGLYKVEELEEDYKTIYKILLNGQMSVNALSNKLNLPISTLNGYLTIMEIKGYIESLPGNEVRIKEV